MNQEINDRNLTDYTLTDFLRLFWDRGSYDNGNFVPLLCPLWYIRNLLIMSILSPILYYIIRYAREAFLLVITFWWMISYHNAFIPQTILFFCLGAYFSIFDINPLQMVLKQKPLFLFFFVVFAVCDIISHTAYDTSINLQLHRLSLIFNIPALLILADWCTLHGYNYKLLPNAAFIVFCVHYPIVIALRKICVLYYTDAPDSIHILLYFICVIISTLLSMVIYFFMDKHLPNIKRILSGNR